MDSSNGLILATTDETTDPIIGFAEQSPTRSDIYNRIASSEDHGLLLIGLAATQSAEQLSA